MGRVCRNLSVGQERFTEKNLKGMFRVRHATLQAIRNASSNFTAYLCILTQKVRNRAFFAAAVRVSSSHQSTKRRQYNGRQENQHGRGQRQGSHAASSMRRNRSIALGRISPSRRNSMRPSSSQFRRPVGEP